MRPPTATLRTSLGLLAGVALWLAPATARAEEGHELDEASKKVMEQMEKVLELMRQNEEALIQISAGARDKPRRVDVEIPDVPPADGASGAGGGSASAGEGGQGSQGAGGGSPSEGGREAARALEEIIRGQRSASGQIPGELEELVRLVPE